MEMEENSSDEVSIEEDKEKRAEWTPEQDLYMISVITAHGPQNWSNISDIMNAKFVYDKKSSKQCRERWYNKLDPAICHSPWTKQEEALLVLAHMKYKNRWCDIAETLKGRHNNMIKNRFYSIFRKVKNKVRNNDFTYRTKLELYETYYMITVIEEYLTTPLPEDEFKRKRGRDFMYTLIKDVDKKLLDDYKETLFKRCPLKSSLEESLKTIANSITKNPRRVASQQTSQPMVTRAETNNTLTPPLEEPMQITKTEETKSTGKLTALFTLPKPNSFDFKEPLSPEEKGFIIANAFQPKKFYPQGVLCPRPHYATPPYLSGNVVIKGGFEEYSKNEKEKTSSFTQIGTDILANNTAFQPLH